MGGVLRVGLAGAWPLQQWGTEGGHGRAHGEILPLLQCGVYRQNSLNQWGTEGDLLGSLREI